MHKELKLKGKGIKGGDQIMTIKVITPKNKNENLEKALLTSVDENVRTF